MHPAFILQLGINFGPLNGGDNFFHSANGGSRAFQHFHFPILRFRVARVHAEKFARKKRSFVSAGAGANFDDDVLVVVGIPGQQQEFQLALDNRAARFELVLLVVGHLLHFRVVRFDQQLLGALQAFLNFLPLAIFGNHLGHFRVRFRELLEARRVIVHFGRRELLGQFFVARFDVIELFKKRQVRHGMASKKTGNQKGNRKNVQDRVRASPGRGGRGSANKRRQTLQNLYTE